MLRNVVVLWGGIVVAAAGSVHCVSDPAPSGDAVVGPEDVAPVDGTVGGETSITDISGLPNDAPVPPDDAAGQPSTLEFMVQVPSQAGGAEGIAVTVRAPAVDQARYPEGAPIAVSVMGGWSPSSPAKVDPKLVDHGVVSVGWLFPGAATMNQRSGGTFDVRGPNCQRALADVILYASGKKPDSEGLTLTDRVAHALTEEVGLIAGSNGGNLAITTLADHASELTGVDWLAAWESPIGDQQANVELNANDDYVAGSCTATSCLVAASFASKLSWNPSLETAARHDASQALSGRLLSTGCPQDAFAKMPSGFVDGELHLYPSQELATVLRDNEQAIFGTSGPPSWLVLDATEVDTYWRSRDGALRIPEVHATFPGLLVMHLQRVEDHVQKQPDYPHATAHLLGWNEVSHAWFRLNPDAAYQEWVLPDAGQPYPENAAGALVTYPGADAQMVPNAIGNGLQLAAVIELADRTRLGDSSSDLTSVLNDYRPSNGGSGPPPGGEAPLCDDGRQTLCCGDGVCGGPENSMNCPQDC